MYAQQDLSSEQFTRFKIQTATGRSPRIMTILNTDNTVPPITTEHFSHRGKAVAVISVVFCHLENRLVPHAWPVLKYRDSRAGLKVNVKRDTSWHTDLHNYIHALHNAGYPVICRRCTCTVSPWNLFARSYVLRPLYAYLTRAKCSHGVKGRPLVNHEGPCVQLYEAFFGTSHGTECGWPLSSRNSFIIVFSLRNVFPSPRNYRRRDQTILAKYICDEKKCKKNRGGCHLHCYCDITSPSHG